MSNNNLEELIRVALSQSKIDPSSATGNQSSGLGALPPAVQSQQADNLAVEIGRLYDVTRQLSGASSSSNTAQPATGKDIGAAVGEAVRSELNSTGGLLSGIAGALTSTGSSNDQGSGAGKAILTAAGMATGLGPLIAGLAGLFGSGGETPAPIQEKFIAPDHVRVDAGLTSDRSISALSYGQDGLAREVQRVENQPRVEIHVQAMDSRSFLDHSDEIARAVQSAMLRSHSLNDVIADL